MAIEGIGEEATTAPVADLFTERGIFDAELRTKAKAALQRLPESAALDSAADRFLAEYSPGTESTAAPGMVRLPENDIRYYFLLYKMPTVDDVLGAAAGGVFPPGWIEARSRQIDGELQQAGKTVWDDFVLFLAKIRIDLVAKGFVEVPEE